MEDQNRGGFRYTYSAKEQAEIRAIREKYAVPAEKDAMEELRRLDASATGKATAVALALGILGALLMGSGMSLVMTELYTWLGLSAVGALLVGVPLGLCGILCVSLAYPLYNRTLRKERARVAPQILAITDTLLK